jgi:hypothetical protein
MVVLATRVYVDGEARQRAMDGLTSMVEDRVGALDVEHTVGLRHDGFPSVTLDGRDAQAGRAALAAAFGAVYPDGPRPGDPGVATLERWSDDGLTLAAGREVFVPADRIGLGPGSPSQVRERFGLVQHLPMQVVVEEPEDAGDAREDRSPLVGELADAERDRLYDWQRGSGRVNVNSATRSEVRATVNRAGHADDIVTIERLGLLEQSIVCRAETDPPGLLSSIGEYLPAEMLCVVP